MIWCSTRILDTRKTETRRNGEKEQKNVVTVDPVFDWSIVITGSMLPVVMVIRSIHQNNEQEGEQQQE